MVSKVSFTNKALSANGGLVIFEQLIKASHLESTVVAALPTPKIQTRATSFNKFRSLVLGFIMGADCLDDMNTCQDDSVFQEISGTALSPTSYGNFLRSFSAPNIRQLQKSLVMQASYLHRRVNPKGDLILDIDSTSHLQYGKKMEGLKVNFSGENSLDSLQVFDQFGIAYHLEVREGATFTAVNAPYVISELARSLRLDFIHRKRFIRADSGYCNNQVFDACDRGGFDFVIALRENLHGGLFRKRHE